MELLFFFPTLRTPRRQGPCRQFDFPPLWGPWEGRGFCSHFHSSPLCGNLRRQLPPLPPHPTPTNQVPKPPYLVRRLWQGLRRQQGGARPTARIVPITSPIVLCALTLPGPIKNACPRCHMRRWFPNLVNEFLRSAFEQWPTNIGTPSSIALCLALHAGCLRCFIGVSAAAPYLLFFCGEQ